MPDQAILEIQDFGKGLPQAVMDRFQRTGASSGVGLAGIRERVKELGGDFTICSTAGGTTLRSAVPLCMENDHDKDPDRDKNKPIARLDGALPQEGDFNNLPASRP